MNMLRYTALRNAKTIVTSVPSLLLTCGEREKKCGENPIDPQMVQCTPDDVFAPENCVFMKLFSLLQKYFKMKGK